MRKRAYRSVRVKDVDAASLESLAPGAVWAGLDVAKAEVLVVLRDNQGDFERPWSVQQTVEIPMLVERPALSEKTGVRNSGFPRGFRYSMASRGRSEEAETRFLLALTSFFSGIPAF